MTMREGRVTGLQRSAGGVPKLPVARATVGADGMEGDRQADRRHHGGRDRALCLYSQERLDGLAAEGHPARRGTLGENVTISGLDWDLVQPGARLRIGGIEAQVTGFAAPCKSIAYGFIDRRFVRVGEALNPGWSRVYARVLAGGDIADGDPVVLLP